MSSMFVKIRVLIALTIYFLALAMQIDKYSVGYLTYRGGMQSLVSTSIIRDTESGYYNFSVQVGLPHSYVSVIYAKKMLKQELKLRIAFK